ncbi:MAG: peptidase M17 [Bacteroidota bacterium]|nr:peptidase M17 [Bacteroidota bacterium]
MMLPVSEISRIPAHVSIVFICKDLKTLPTGYFSAEELQFIKKWNKEDKKEFFSFNRLNSWNFVQIVPQEKDPFKRNESLRKSGDSLSSALNENKSREVILYNAGVTPEEFLAWAEGLILGNYQFIQYKTGDEKKHTLEKVSVYSPKMPAEWLDYLNVTCKAVYKCRDLINEPNSYLTAGVFADEVEKLAHDAGAFAEVLKLKKIETLKMGGLLAVNKGSQEPPVFMILEWKPQKPVNKNPYVFVGKGITFDSGGMNLKPGDSMYTMKDDMSGAAAVATAVCAVAEARLPVHVVGLIPATDNRPGPNAIVPGDVIKMYSGLNVEVANTDAEGRLILADALHYAKKFNPALVVDLATLTGAAQRAVGRYGIVAMQVKAEKELEDLKRSGWEVFERLVEFPAWEEYGEWIKSDIADIKNSGVAEAGAITAGKFLERFTDYPYIHLDIAGTAFLDKKDSYRGQAGTGTGVRLIFDFIRHIALAKQNI